MSARKQTAPKPAPRKRPPGPARRRSSTARAARAPLSPVTPPPGSTPRSTRAWSP